MWQLALQTVRVPGFTGTSQTLIIQSAERCNLGQHHRASSFSGVPIRGSKY